MTPDATIIVGDAVESLRALPDASVHCCVTSPPYFGLRDYGHDGQIGLEDTPDAFVAKLVDVFREVRRVLRDEGTLWLNLGDSYCSIGGEHKGRSDNQAGVGAGSRQWREGAARADGDVRSDGVSRRNRDGTRAPGLKPKDLIGIPWRVAFALQADGWYLRQDIIWHKPNPMPESVRDRCTKAHEYLFLLSKSPRYHYDAEAVSEAASTGTWDAMPPIGGVKHAVNEFHGGGVYSGKTPGSNGTRNRRSVWSITTKPYSGAHFAVMPPDLVEPCVRAGCPEGGTVLDPFAGSGTTLQVAYDLGRSSIGIELNPEYAELARRRVAAARDRVALFAEADA